MYTHNPIGGAVKAVIKLVFSRLSLRKSNPGRAMVFIMVLFIGLPGGMIAGTSAIKAEIENGPNRALTMMHPDYWVLQKGSTNVITSSFVPRSLVDDLNQIEGIRAVGVVRDFRAVEHGGSSREAILYSYQPEISEMSPDLIEGSQTTTGVVIDTSLADALSVGVGDSVSIAGLDLQIQGITSGTSAIGKEGVFVPESIIYKMVPEGDYTALLVLAESGAELPKSVEREYSVYTQSEFLDLNARYWAENASGLAITLMQTAGLFGTLILVVSLVAMLSQSRRQLAMLRAIGGTSRQVWGVEMVFLLLLALASVALQVPVGYLVVQAANASTPGFAGQLTSSDVTTGLVAVLVIALIFGSVITRRFIKKLQHPAAILAATR